MIGLGSTADTERRQLEQASTAEGRERRRPGGDSSGSGVGLTKKQRIERTRKRQKRAWLYPEDEALEADMFWRQRGGQAVYYSRRRSEPRGRGRQWQRQQQQQHGRGDRGSARAPDLASGQCAAAIAVGGGLGESVEPSVVRAPQGCEPLVRLHKPVVALVEARASSENAL